MKFLLLLLAVPLFGSCGHLQSDSKQTPAEQAESDKGITHTESAVKQDTTFHKSADPADSVWIDALNRIQLPASIHPDSLINVYFKYRQSIDGYEVTARWFPFDDQSETGRVVMNFRNIANGASFQYTNFEKYDNINTDNIAFSNDFKGYKNGDVYYLEYITPDNPDSNPKDNSPIGYLSPFQFTDVDFDGKAELLINDWSRDREGNGYAVYKIKGDSVSLMDDAPFNDFVGQAIFDYRKKTIAFTSSSSAFNTARWVYRLHAGNRVIDKIYPETLDESGKYVLENYYKAPAGSFILDSLYEWSQTSTGKFLYIYADKNGKITLIEKRKIGTD